jgi:hypothetical protein
MVEVGEPVGQPGGLVLAEGGCELSGEVVDVFAGVVVVDDLGGLGQDFVGHVPDPPGAVAEEDELAHVVGAAAAGLGVHQGAELLDRVEGVHVAGGVRIAHRVALLELGLGEQAGQLDLAGAGPAVLALAGPVGRG